MVGEEEEGEGGVGCLENRGLENCSKLDVSTVGKVKQAIRQYIIGGLYTRVAEGRGKKQFDALLHACFK